MTNVIKQNLPPGLAQRYIIQGKLGEGTYGIVYKVQELANPSKEWAIKLIHLNNQEITSGVFAELSILRRLKHPNLIRLKEFELQEQEDPFADSPTTEIALVLELAESDLSQLINTEWFEQGMYERKDVQLPLQLQVAHEMLCGLNFLHANGILHLDLKPNNILYKNGHAKLADFGLSERSEGFKGLGQNTVTWNYRAPELQCNTSHGYNESADIWSIGVILCKMFFYNDLFKHDAAPLNHESDLFTNITQKIAKPSATWFTKYSPEFFRYRCPKPELLPLIDEPTEPFDFPNTSLSNAWQEFLKGPYYGPELYEQIWDLIRRCLQLDPVARITALEAMNHPIFAKFCSLRCSACQQPQSIYHIAPRSEYALSNHVIDLVQATVRQDESKIAVLLSYADEIYRRFLHHLEGTEPQTSIEQKQDLFITYQEASTMVAMKLLKYDFDLLLLELQFVNDLANKPSVHTKEDLNHWELHIANMIRWNFDGPETEDSEMEEETPAEIEQ